MLLVMMLSRVFVEFKRCGGGVNVFSFLLFLFLEMIVFLVIGYVDFTQFMA